MPTLTSITFLWPDGTTFVAEPANVLPGLRPTVPLGSLHNALVTGEQQANNGHPAYIAFQNDPDLLFEALRLLQETSYQFTVILPMSVAEAMTLKVASASAAWPFSNVSLARYVQVLSPGLWKQEVGPNSKPRTFIGAVFNARGYSGVVDLTIQDERHRMNAEIVTAKLHYETEFKHLLSEVADQQIQLLYEIGSIAGERLRGNAVAPSDLPSILFQVRKLMLSDELPAAVETILASPLETLITEEENNPAAVNKRPPQAALLSRRIAQMGFVEGGGLRDLFHGSSPRRLPAAVKRQTFDNAENRYAKNFLSELRETLNLLQEACRADNKWIQAEEVGRWTDLVDEWLVNDLWRDVGPLSAIPHNSQRLQKSAGYRDLFRADAELREALTIPLRDERLDRSSTSLGDIKPVDTLYEYWCYFVVRQILRELYGPDVTSGKGLVVKSAGRLSMRLSSKTEGYSAVYVQGLPPGVKIHLFFNRRFQPTPDPHWGVWSGTYSVAFDPDISIAVYTEERTHWLNFDAKYRLERILWEDVGQSEPEPSNDDAFKQEDLNKMHCYRDAILGTRGAYVLFPGTSDQQTEPYLRTSATSRRGVGVPSVGAFPLRPRNPVQREALKEFIRRMIEMLASTDTYREETALD